MIEKLEAVIREAGLIMLQADNIKEDVENKEGRANFVTKYDVEVQKFLFHKLSVLFPEATFIGEEDNAKDNKHGDFCFIIDPIDGTTNFIFDMKYSAISIGLMQKEEITIGMVYNPYLDELFYAEKGKGAYLNGKRLQMRNTPLKEGVIGFGTCPYNPEKTEETFQLTRKIFNHALDIRRSGAATLDLCNVAAGRYVLFYELVLSPWDYAAGSLIITEAGGCISTVNKEPLPLTKVCSAVAATPAAYQEFFSL
jgi:myo-inositol-1(or 4)-monophosphatase